MTARLRQLLHDYATRRSPWGPPWWIYGVAFGVANLIRQAVIIAIPSEIPQVVRIASWVLTALLVFGIVTGVAVVRRIVTRRDVPAIDGRGGQPALDPAPRSTSVSSSPTIACRGFSVASVAAKPRAACPN